MSVTDRAFIRVYSQDQQDKQAPPEAEPSSPPEAVEITTVETTLADDALSHLYSFAECTPTGMHSSFDATVTPEEDPIHRGDNDAANSPRPHANFPSDDESDDDYEPSAVKFRRSQEVVELQNEPPSVVVEVSDSPDEDDESVDYYGDSIHPRAEQKPAPVSPTIIDDMDDFDDIPTAHVDRVEASLSADPLRPALEVDGFSYPNYCDRLRAQLAEGLGDVAHNLKLTAAAGQRVLAIAGCRRNEGRTTTLLCLARELAARGARVAVVDADFEKPDLAEQMGLAVPVGWEQAVRGQMELSEAVIEARDESVTLVALREPVPDARTLMTRGRPDLVIAELKRTFDIVLVDLGPVLDVAAGVSGLPFAGRAGIDAVVLVRDARSESKTDLPTARKRLAASGVEVLGVIETFAPPEVLPFHRAANTELVGAK